MNQQMILAILPYIIPSATALIVYIYHQIFHALPAKQQQALKQLEILASPAVQAVEQLYEKAPPQQKKQIAIQAIELGLQFANLPIPDEKILNTFIEDAVFEMNILKGKAGSN
jgi:LL-H family phage holin